MEPQQSSETDLSSKLAERFKELPKPVQNAITSADVQKHMRQLADMHKLHLDQWQSLENEVMLTLLGFQETEDLEENIRHEVNLPGDVAKAIADDVSRVVFEPVRKELERELAGNGGSAAPEHASGEVAIEEPEKPSLTIAPTPLSTPSPAPATKVERPPVSASYTPQLASHERKTIDDDPYREQVG